MITETQKTNLMANLKLAVLLSEQSESLDEMQTPPRSEQGSGMRVLTSALESALKTSIARHVFREALEAIEDSGLDFDLPSWIANHRVSTLATMATKVALEVATTGGLDCDTADPAEYSARLSQVSDWLRKILYGHTSECYGLLLKWGEAK